MSDNKVLINIVYAPQKGPPHKVYSNERGEIWHSKKKDPKKINIGMGWYSIRNPKPGDNILVVEPRCVLERDYRIDFVRRFRHIFTWAHKAFPQPKLKNKIVPINHPSCAYLLNKKNIGNDWLPWNRRSNEIVIVANNKSSQHNSELYSLRKQLADLFSRNKTFKVSWYGQIPMKNTSYYKGNIKSKHQILKRAKFSICTENSYHPVFSHNYFTEKMPEVWAAGCIPLYMGCYNINRFGFPENSYIDLRRYVKIQNGRAAAKGKYTIAINKLMQVMTACNKHKYTKFVNSVKNEVLTQECLFHHISPYRVYDTMINTFYKGG